MHLSCLTQSSGAILPLILTLKYNEIVMNSSINQSKFEVLNTSFLLLARLLFGMLFIPAGFNKIVGFSGTVSYITAMGMPMPTIAAISAIIVEVIFGICLLLGFQQRFMAIILAIFTLFATFVFHAFWSVPAENAYMQQLLFYKNMAVVGGLFAFIVAVGQPHKLSIDSMLKKR